MNRKCSICGRRIGDQGHLVAEVGPNGTEKAVVHDDCASAQFRAQLEGSLQLLRDRAGVAV